MPPDKRHIPALDGIRGIAVLMVIVFHFYQALPPDIDPIFRMIQRVSQVGQLGVDLFFVLSGFLITGILLRSKGSEGYLRNFYARRILRIFPLYYGFLIFYYFVLPHFSGAAGIPFRTQTWYWTFTQNIAVTFLKGGIPGPGHFWSLAVEEHFYLIWPILVLCLNETALRWCIVLMFLTALVARIALLSAGYGVFFFTLSRLDGLAMGSLLAILAAGSHSLTRLTNPARLVLGCGLLLGVPLYLITSGSGSSWLQVFKFPGIALILGAGIVMAATAPDGSLVERFVCCSPLRSCGKYSYGMYVLHPTVLTLVFVYSGTDHLLAWRRFAMLLLAMGATFCCAYALWHMYERHFLKLKRYFEYAPPRGSSPVLATA